MKYDRKLKIVRISAIVLAILLSVSATALAGTVLHGRSSQSQATSVVSGNVIAPQSAHAVAPLSLSSRTYRLSPVAPVAPLAGKPAGSTIVDQAEGETVTLQIYRFHAEDSTPFRVENMFPGDIESKSYYLEVSYKGSVTVCFHADIRSGYEKLAEVLKCRISLRDGTLFYDGLMRDMPQCIYHTLPETAGATKTFIYDISVYLDTSVGNEYMAKELRADFRWWVDEDNSEIPSETTKPSTPTEPSEPSTPTQPTEPSVPSEPTVPSTPTEPTVPSIPDETTEPSTPDETTAPTKPSGSGELILPQTGVNMHLFCIWFWIAMASLLLNILLLLSRSRDKGGERGDRE